MQSVILIGNNDFTLEQIIRTSHHGSVSTYLANSERFVVEFEDGRLYYDVDPNIIDGYEDDELKLIPYTNPKFISLSYSSTDLLSRVLLQETYIKNIWIDNDHDLICPIEEFANILRKNS